MATDREILEGNLNNIQNREPVLLGTAIVQAIVASLAVAASFGLDMTQEQTDAMWKALVAFSTILWLVAPVIRQHVYAPATVAKIEAK